MRILFAFFLLILASGGVKSQKLSKSDKKLMDMLKTHVTALSSDSMMGRRAGTKGELMAGEYIMSRFRELDIEPVFSFSEASADQAIKTYVQPFEIAETKHFETGTALSIDNISLEQLKDYFPLAFSGESVLDNTASVALQENGSVWFYDLAELIEQSALNPHSDIYDEILAIAVKSRERGAAALLMYNSAGKDDVIRFIPSDKRAPAGIPLLYMTKDGMKKSLQDSIGMHQFHIRVSMEKTKRMGRNIVGMINNNSEINIVVGAHYDHLGYGEDNNSLYAGSNKLIHNGADDNASGVAAMLEIARMLKKEKAKKYNYLFVAFSGEELGLFGSKYFTAHCPVSLASINYMLNLDMVGRLNDSSKTLTIGGFGTSPQWAELLKSSKQTFVFKYDSSGSGPSDHTSFYKKDIPVLFFFTGLHHDYHKPSDDAEHINFKGQMELTKMIFQLVKNSEKTERLAFTKTRDRDMTAKSSFKVTLGIMPDYTYSGTGVRLDGVSAGKLAERAGLKEGDIILKIASYPISDIQAYMKVLGAFSKGDPASIEIKRGNDILNMDIVF
jgi:aminopeptidase YwaD